MRFGFPREIRTLAENAAREEGGGGRGEGGTNGGGGMGGGGFPGFGGNGFPGFGGGGGGGGFPGFGGKKKRSIYAEEMQGMENELNDARDALMEHKPLSIRDKRQLTSGNRPSRGGDGGRGRGGPVTTSLPIPIPVNGTLKDLSMFFKDAPMDLESQQIATLKAVKLDKGCP